jgi:predicted O-methyltransferase YrrM
MIREANLLWQYQDTDSGLIMPYYTLPCLEWLKKQDVSKWNVFEFGAGYSTIWWKLNCYFVKSVDSNESWAKAMGADLIKNELNHNIIAYNRHIKDYHLNSYDCIIIDGDPIEWRPSCVEFCRDYVKPGGYIIIDNYSQEGFPADFEYDKFLQAWGKQVFSQPNHSSWKTAVFKKQAHIITHQ